MIINLSFRERQPEESHIFNSTRSFANAQDDIGMLNATAPTYDFIYIAHSKAKP